ncbi:lysylphosphatidylglycerol synthase transmembrane domain-containing protein [Lentzea kentuckyensis]|uniref:lysylphosphatidylglycerol synthase transmembrane domain-containing protein n=1 Tax=Lentzea kentuckyensis TaxID=360086 RepID=UPI001302811A|nr:lysylphosphatidylglycerol synthase transmembrane domain-containing protein [Lentzea kentuckyensis]
MIARLPATDGRNQMNVLVRFVAAAAVAVAVVAFVRYAAQADIAGVLRQIDPLWTAVALATFLVPLLGNVITLRAVAPMRLPWGPTAAAQLAGTFGNLVAPANIGGMAMNVRFLCRRGVSAAGAAGAVGATQIVAAFVTVALAVPSLASSGQLADVARSAVSGPVLAIVVAVVPIGMVLLRRTAPGRRISARLRSVLADAPKAARRALASPGSAALTVAGNLLVTLGTAATLGAAVQAFGGTASFGDLLLVVAGGTLAAVVPLPGGGGSAELILTAQLVAVGLDAPVALAAAVLYRLVTFWSRIPLGWLAFSWLRRSGQL